MESTATENAKRWIHTKVALGVLGGFFLLVAVVLLVLLANREQTEVAVQRNKKKVHHGGGGGANGTHHGVDGKYFLPKSKTKDVTGEKVKDEHGKDMEFTEEHGRPALTQAMHACKAAEACHGVSEYTHVAVTGGPEQRTACAWKNMTNIGDITATTGTVSHDVHLMAISRGHEGNGKGDLTGIEGDKVVAKDVEGIYHGFFHTASSKKYMPVGEKMGSYSVLDTAKQACFAEHQICQAVHGEPDGDIFHTVRDITAFEPTTSETYATHYNEAMDYQIHTEGDIKIG